MTTFLHSISPARFQPTQDGLNQQDGLGTTDGQRSKQYQTDPQQEQVQRLAPLQSPAASEQAQHQQQPQGLSSSPDAAAGKQQEQQQQEQQQQCHEGHRQLLHQQSAPAGSSFAAAAARAAMLPDVSHLHINTHASHAAQKLAGVPECGEVKRVGISVLLVTVLWTQVLPCTLCPVSLDSESPVSEWTHRFGLCLAARGC